MINISIVSFAASFSLDYQIFKPDLQASFRIQKSSFQLRMNLISIIIIIGMKNAKRFLRENPNESKIVAAKIFNVKANTLSVFIRRDSIESKRDEHNKILQNHEINAFDDFIRSLLTHDIAFTCELVFSAIVDLKRAHHRETSSKRCEAR
jgi:hypothetical protein